MAPSTTHLPAPSKHIEFTRWALENGLKLLKIAPALIPSAGLGIVSTAAISGPQQRSSVSEPRRRDFSEGEEIAFCPTSLLINRDNVREFAPGLPESVLLAGEGVVSTHALLAAAVVAERANEGNKWRPWVRILPTLEEFREIMPMLWGDEERELLPPPSKMLLQQMQTRFSKDWDSIRALDLGFTKEVFTHAWLVVNTRSLYYRPEHPSSFVDLPTTRHMTLCPFVDYFNHSSSGCKVELSNKGYSVTSTVPHAEGEQIFVSYGCHSNDFLLVEYGFLLPDRDNKWDEVRIDSLLLSELKPAHKNYLEAEGFLGNYVFDWNLFCYRTQAAVRMALIPVGGASEGRMVERWRGFLAGEEEGGREQPVVDQFLLRLLKRSREASEEALGKVERLREGYAKTCLKERWGQILEMIGGVEEELGG